MNRSVRIVAFGDSITNGVGLAKVSEADTFRDILQRKLTEKLGQTVEVVNAGVNGDVVTLAAKRLEKDVLAHKPDIVTIMFGGNEAGFYRPNTNGFADTPRVGRKEFAATLEKIVDRLQAARIKVVLMTCPPMTERYWGAYLKPYQDHGINFLVKDYAQAMREVAAKKDVPLIDVYREFEKDSDTLDYFPDGLHPDPRGHRMIAELLVERLARIIDPRGSDSTRLSDADSEEVPPAVDEFWDGLTRESIQLGHILLTVKGSKGVAGCIYLNVDTFERFGEACAIIPAGNFDKMLDAKVSAVTSQAKALGIEVGMPGREALELLR